MGFWHTGYLDLNEPTGWGNWDPSDSQLYKCQICSSSFSTAESLSHHRQQNHRYRPPILTVLGKDLGELPLLITTALQPSDIAVSDNVVFAELNDNVVKNPHVDLAQHLSAVHQGRVTVKLRAEGVSKTFLFDFNITSPEDLRGVEKEVDDLLKGKTLDHAALESFIRRTDQFRTAKLYREGILDYFYGVIIKENRGNQKNEVYRGKLERAANSLQLFERPIARIICCVVAFHFNQFKVAASLAKSSRVGRISHVFNEWVYSFNHKTPLNKLVAGFSPDMHITDYDTEAVLALFRNRLSLGELKSLLDNFRSELDRPKLWILGAELALLEGNDRTARDFAAKLRNNPDFGEWAENIYSITKAL